MNMSGLKAGVLFGMVNLVSAGAWTAMGGEGINVNAGGAHVKVGADGGVQVNMPGTGLRVNGAGVSADVNSAQPLEGGMTFDGVEQSWTVKCDGTKVQSVVVNGTENKAAITGSCKSITVNGVDNKVTAEYVGNITLTGTDNSVTYKMGLDGKAPKVVSSGVDNKAIKIK